MAGDVSPVAMFLAGEITWLINVSLLWVRCASGNVLFLRAYAYFPQKENIRENIKGRRRERERISVLVPLVWLKRLARSRPPLRCNE